MDDEQDEQEDLKEVILEETNRGRRRIDPKAREERKQKLNSARKLLTIATEAEFLKAMRAVGLREGSLNFRRLYGFGVDTDLSDCTIESA